MQDQIKEIVVNSERIRYWMSVGAQPSDRVAWLLGKVGVLPPAVPRDMSANKIPKVLQEKKKVAGKKK
jgi:small subunit ribosomal protein S16